MIACQTIGSKQARKGWKEGWPELKKAHQATEEKKTGQENERLPAASVDGPFLCAIMARNYNHFSSKEDGLNFLCSPNGPFQFKEDQYSGGLAVCCHKREGLNRDQYRVWR